MDLTVRPGDDFYEYANGGWLRRTAIPPGYNSWGTFAALRRENAELLHGILEAAAKDSVAAEGSPTRLLGDFYRAAMDTPAIERAGAGQLAPQKCINREDAK